MNLMKTNVPVVDLKCLFLKILYFKEVDESVVHKFLNILLCFLWGEFPYIFYPILCRSALLYKLDSLLSCCRKKIKKTYFIVGQIAQPRIFGYLVTYKE